MREEGKREREGEERGWGKAKSWPEVVGWWAGWLEQVAVWRGGCGEGRRLLVTDHSGCQPPTPKPVWGKGETISVGLETCILVLHLTTCSIPRLKTPHLDWASVLLSIKGHWSPLPSKLHRIVQRSNYMACTSPRQTVLFKCDAYKIFLSAKVPIWDSFSEEATLLCLAATPLSHSTCISEQHPGESEILMHAAKTTAYVLHRGDSTLPHSPAMLQFHSQAQQPLPRLGPGDRLQPSLWLGVGHHPLTEITTLSKEQGSWSWLHLIGWLTWHWLDTNPKGAGASEKCFYYLMWQKVKSGAETEKKFT